MKIVDDIDGELVLSKTAGYPDFTPKMCPSCGKPGVKYRGAYACKTCNTILQQAIPGWEPEAVPFGLMFPNRASRRGR